MESKEPLGIFYYFLPKISNEQGIKAIEIKQK